MVDELLALRSLAAETFDLELYLTWPIQGLNEIRKDVLDVHELAGLYIYIYWLYPM
jgi:hypothetical protein